MKNELVKSSVSNNDIEKIYQPVIDHAREQDEILTEQVDTLVDIYGEEREALTASKASKAQKECLKDPIIKEIYQNAHPYYCMYVNQ